MQAQGLGIPSSVTNIVTFVGYGYSCQVFWKHDKAGEVEAFPLLQKSPEDISLKSVRLKFQLVLHLCGALWLSAKVGLLSRGGCEW